METYVAGWDGGGTKTLCEVRFAGGSTRQLAAGALNPNGTAAGQMQATITALLAQMAALPGGLAACRGLCVGAAGISNPQAAAHLRAALAAGGYPGPLTLVGDEEAALYGALGGAPGVMLIAGTGSICRGRNAAGAQARAGGWGCLMDDLGSGYALGRAALAAAVQAEDSRLPRTVLRDTVPAALGAADIQALIGVVYAPGFGKREVAALAPLVLQASEAGDAAAQQILAQAADDLVALVVPVTEKLGLQDACLAFGGGLLTNPTPLRAALLPRLAARFPALRPIPPAGNAAHGAALLAEQACLRDA